MIVCPACVAAITLPLALFLLLAETAVGGAATVIYLRLSSGLTQGFLKFIAVTYAIVGALAFFTVLAGPPAAYHDRLGVDRTAGATLVFLQGLMEAGTVRSVIDRSYPLEETGAAIAYVEAGHARGKVVVTT